MYSYDGPERDSYSETYSRISGYKAGLFWLAWVVATYFGFVLGESWANNVVAAFMPTDATTVPLLSLEESVQSGTAVSYLIALEGAVIAGTVLALAQSLVMFPFLKLSGTLEWFAVTFVGRVLRWMAVYAISREFVRLTFDFFTGGIILGAFLIGIAVIAGLALGYPQMQAMARRTHHPELVMLANISGPVVSAIIVLLCLIFELENTISGWSVHLTAGITAAATGIAMVTILKNPTTEAEWSTMFRQNTKKMVRAESNTVLGSTLYDTPSTPRP